MSNQEKLKVDAVFLARDADVLSRQTVDDFIQSKKRWKIIKRDEEYMSVIYHDSTRSHFPMDSWIIFYEGNFSYCDTETFQESYEPCTP